MSIWAGRLGLAVVVVAALCLGGRTAHAQAAPLTYWTPGWPLGFGGDLAGGQGASTYGNSPSFNGSAQGGFGYTRYNFSNGWFVGSERGAMGLSATGLGASGFSQDPAFSNFGSVYSEGMQFGYSFKNVGGGLPVTLFAGVDTLKYNTGIGSPLSPFDSQSGTLQGYSAHAGIEFQPTSNLSLSLGVGYTQQSNRLDINSPFGGLR